MFHLGKLLPRSSASAQSSSCNPTNRTSVVSAVLDRLRPRGCVRGRLCSQPGRRLQAAGHKAADQLRLQEHAEPRARLSQSPGPVSWWPSHPCTQPPQGFSASCGPARGRYFFSSDCALFSFMCLRRHTQRKTSTQFLAIAFFV